MRGQGRCASANCDKQRFSGSADIPVHWQGTVAYRAGEMVIPDDVEPVAGQAAPEDDLIGEIARAAGPGVAAVGRSGEDRCMTRHQLDPSPLTRAHVFSRDLPPVLTVDPGDTIV